MVINSLKKFFTVHTALTACMCPVDHICHHLTCHRRLFSLSRISHTQLSTYIIYMSMVCLTSVVEVCQILEFDLCGCISRLSLHLPDDHASEVHYSLLMTATVSSQCAALSSPSILNKKSELMLMRRATASV